MLVNNFKNCKIHSGFTLVEIAIVIMISGFIMLMGAQFIKLYTINSQREKTVDNVRITQDAINEFFGLNGRYPCPADPTLVSSDANYGLERCRSATNLDDNPDNCIGTPANLSCTTNFSRDGNLDGHQDIVMIGIVPFRTIADKVVDTPYFENYRFDGYSTYISYAVTEHMSDERFNLFNPVNPNTGGVRVEDENNISITIPDASAHYVVYSHGDNRKGGYSSAGVMVENCFVPSLIPGDPPVLPAPGPSGGGIDVEIENCDNNDAIFIKGIRSMGDNDDYIDDVLFFTSTGLKPLWKNFLNSPAGESYIYNTNLGHVGVGTLDPTHDLHIVGNISAEESTIANSYCDGIGSHCLEPAAIAGAGSNCSDSRQVAYAIQDNKIVCRNIDWLTPVHTCPAGKYISAISNLGTVICDALP